MNRDGFEGAVTGHVYGWEPIWRYRIVYTDREKHAEAVALASRFPHDFADVEIVLETPCSTTG